MKSDKKSRAFQNGPREEPRSPCGRWKHATPKARRRDPGVPEPLPQRHAPPLLSQEPLPAGQYPGRICPALPHCPGKVRSASHTRGASRRSTVPRPYTDQWSLFRRAGKDGATAASHREGPGHPDARPAPGGGTSPFGAPRLGYRNLGVKRNRK